MLLDVFAEAVRETGAPSDIVVCLFASEIGSSLDMAVHLADKHSREFLVCEQLFGLTARCRLLL